MINQQLIDFVRQSLLKGETKVKITSDLLANEWTISDIDECFSVIESPIYINNNETPIKEENGSGKKVLLLVIILLLIAGGASGYYFRNSLPIVKDLIKSRTVSVNNFQPDLKPKNIINESVDTVQTQPEQKAETQIPSPVTQELELPAKVTPTVPPNTSTSAVTGPIACGTNMSCFIAAAKNCSPAVVEQIRTISIFGTYDITNKSKLILSGINAAKKCGYTSHVDDASMEYSQDMLKTIKMEMDKRGDSLTNKQKQEAYTVPVEAAASAKNTIGMTTKCSFKPTDLVNLLTKWENGESNSNDLAFGSCIITDAKGKSVPLLFTGSTDITPSSSDYTLYDHSKDTDIYINKQTIFSNKSISLSDIKFILLESTDKGDFNHVFKISVTKMTTGENQIITFDNNNNNEFVIFGLKITYVGYSKGIDKGIETTKVSVQISQQK